MVLRLREHEGEYIWLGQRPVRAPMTLMMAASHGVLTLTLDRYVRGEVAGRALLIGGYRGSGKTALARHAVEQLTLDVILALARKPEARSSASGTLQRRPLLVKLHGPSLLINELTEDASSKAAAAVNKPADAAGKSADASDKRADAAEGPRAATPRTNDNNEKAPDNLLAQITIALYRALAQEFEVSFRSHARDERERELAAEFELDLDSAVPPAALRTYWNSIGRLHEGVLWPKALSDAGRRVDGTQGLKEITALATAGQAYQVCIGAVGYSRQQKGTQSRTVEGGSVPFDINQAIGKIGGLAAGGAAGVGAMSQFEDIVGATIVALATGVAASLALSWTEKRSSREEMSVEYSFIRDRSLNTLDRDLPVVIQRIREAGLAPVFVIDELDKLGLARASGQTEPDHTIATIINRLKHLTTDYGFFCFLTDRAYFERLHRKLEKAVFPREHTYFSERLLVYYKPQAVVNYLNDVIVAEDRSDEPSGRSRFAKRMLCRLIAHRSLLSAVNVERELSLVFAANRETTDTVEAIVSNAMIKLHVAVQLAIEHTLRGQDIRERMERDSLFAQLAVDALYLISRRWMEDGPKIDLSRQHIAKLLLHHLNVDVGDLDAGKTYEQRLYDSYGEFDLTPVVVCVHYLASLLCNLPDLADTLERDKELDADARSLLVAVREAPGPGPAGREARPPGLLRKGEGHIYHFCYDAFARDLGAVPVDDAAVPDDWFGLERKSEFDTLKDYFEATQELFKEHKISADDLVAAQVLPQTFSWSEIEKAIENLNHGTNIDAELRTLRSLPDAFEKHAPVLAAAIGVAVLVGSDRELAPGQVIRLIQRVLDFELMSGQDETTLRKELGSILATRPNSPLNLGIVADQSAHSMRNWRNHLVDVRNHPRIGWDGATEARQSWSRWQGRLTRFFDDGNAIVDDLTYSEIILAAEEEPPSRLFRRDLSKMDGLEWSKLALEGGRSVVDDGQSAVPAWGLHAGLLGLGFDKTLLRILPERLAISMESTTGRPEPGTLVLLKSDGPLPDERSNTDRFPLITLYAKDLGRYVSALEWLRDHTVIVDQADED